jgi:hypothetical protein
MNDVMCNIVWMETYLNSLRFQQKSMLRTQQLHFDLAKTLAEVVESRYGTSEHVHADAERDTHQHRRRMGMIHATANAVLASSTSSSSSASAKPSSKYTRPSRHDRTARAGGANVGSGSNSAYGSPSGDSRPGSVIGVSHTSSARERTESTRTRERERGNASESGSDDDTAAQRDSLAMMRAMKHVSRKAAAETKEEGKLKLQSPRRSSKLPALASPRSEQRKNDKEDDSVLI